MSELIQMRQRIKAIETIKKVTHAMRLLSMSMHTRLRTKKSVFEDYKQTASSLFDTLRTQAPDWRSPLLEPLADDKPALLIIIGSQKGLCGNFNNNLLTFVNHETNSYQNRVEYILIGKKIIDSFNKATHSIVFDSNQLTINNIASLARLIVDHLIKHPTGYSTIDVYFNYPKTFFAQKPVRKRITPLSFPQTSSSQSMNEYHWEQSPDKILDTFVHTILYNSLYETLLTSLTAEYAARFVAMDSSTSNASSLLDTMKLQYNKIRQAKITRELTDLISGL